MKYYTNIKESTIKEDIKLLLMIKNSLKDHEISQEKNIYRMHHICFTKDLYGTNHESHAIFEPFKLPEGMSRKDGMMVLSYLTDLIEKSENIQECSLKSVKTLEVVLDIYNLGFQRVETKNDAEIVDLYTIQGRTKMFKISKYYPKYFNWYTSNVSREQVKKIYNDLGIELKDLSIKTKVKRR